MDEYLELRRKYVPRAVYFVHPITIVRGANEKLYDLEGREYIDFTSGIGVTNLGHSHPELIKAAQKALQDLWHISIHVANYPSYVMLAKKLSEKVSLDGEAKVAFFNSGAEAIENSAKIARASTGRPYLISFIGGFHGRTALALSLTGKYKPYKVNFEPLASGVVKALYPYCYRLPARNEEECLDLVFSYLEHLIDVDLSPEVVAAVLVEPIQGESGFIVPPKRFLPYLERLTRKRGILLIVDEIQTGYCRTGKFLAHEHYGVKPDLVTLGKAIANGLPLSAVIARASVVDKLIEGSLGGTFGGNPVAAAVAIKVLEIIERDKLCERAEMLGKIMSEKLDELANKYDFIGEHRGLGIMRAIELVKKSGSKEPDEALAKRVIEKAREKGLLLLRAGYYGNVIRLHPPLTISEESLLKGLEILDETLREASLTS